MEFTREQTIIEHRKMWNWIADNLGKTIETVYDLKARYCKERDLKLAGNCFCCDYTIFDCGNCPLYWGSENNDFDTYCESKIENAINWYEAEKLCLKGKFEEAAEMARKIANLPEKVYQNKECGNIHFTYDEMIKEAMEIYDIGDSTNVNDWRECYEVKPLTDFKRQ